MSLISRTRFSYFYTYVLFTYVEKQPTGQVQFNQFLLEIKKFISLTDLIVKLMLMSNMYDVYLKMLYSLSDVEHI